MVLPPKQSSAKDAGSRSRPKKSPSKRSKPKRKKRRKSSGGGSGSSAKAKASKAKAKAKPAPEPTPEPAQRSESITETLLRLHRTGQGEELVKMVVSLLSQLSQRNAELELKIRKLLQEQSGRRSEKVSADQLMLMFEALEEAEASQENEAGADDAESRREKLEEEEKAISAAAVEEDPDPDAPEKQPKRKRKPKRTPLPLDLPRETIQLDLSEAEKQCATCDQPMPHIGDEVSEVLELVPARFIVKQYVRPKHACPQCKDGVAVAPPALKPIDGGVPGPRLLAQIISSKYDHHEPLHRLHRRFAEDGVPLAVSTMADWVAHVGRELRPLWELLQQRVLRAHIVQTDGSGLKVLDRDHPSGIRKGTMWCYVGDRRDVVFLFTPTGHAREGPWDFLDGRTGYVQADASPSYDRLFNGRVATATEVGCWAHARRKYFDIKDVDFRVAWPLRCIRLLYIVEREANKRMLPSEARLRLRDRMSTIQLDRLETWLKTMLPKEPPTSAMAKAMAYMINHWTALTQFLTDGDLELDNTRVEREFRRLALGRRNYLFAGSHAGATNAAILYSTIGTCHAYGVPVRDYLADILMKLAAGWPQSRLPDLLPHAWGADNKIMRPPTPAAAID